MTECEKDGSLDPVTYLVRNPIHVGDVVAAVLEPTTGLIQDYAELAIKIKIKGTIILQGYGADRITSFAHFDDIFSTGDAIQGRIAKQFAGLKFTHGQRYIDVPGGLLKMLEVQTGLCFLQTL